jgi:hypothetical protein
MEVLFMNKQTLDQLDAELKEIIRIEQVMKYSLLTPGDVISLQELANKGLPRAEFLYGLMLLERRKHAEAINWLNRCQRHCNEVYLGKIKKVFKIIGFIEKLRI